MAVKQAPAKAPLHPWTWPSRPWQRIHADFAGPFIDKSFLLVVDARSKWAEVVEMPQTTTARTIVALRRMFATHSIPDQNPQFVSSDFAEFTKMNGIKHSRSSPYHPASNGEAERVVRTFKEAMKAGKNDGLTLCSSYGKFPVILSHYPSLHCSVRGRSLRTMVKPNVAERVKSQQCNQKKGHDQHARMRVFNIGQSVMVRNF